MRKAGIGVLTDVLVPAAVLGMSLAQAPGLAQTGPSAAGPMVQEGKVVVILQYAAPTSATWGPSPAAPPTFAFGKPAEVLLVIPGGYVVRQEMPHEDAILHAEYVSRQIGQPITVTIPDPAGGPARVEYIGRSGGDVGK
jgi:hypothetical protein